MQMQSKRSLSSSWLLFSTALSFPFLFSGQAVAGPSGGIVVGGSAVIEQSGSSTTIHQSTERGIIKWNSFDIGAAEHVDVQQPSSSSITVNRILDSKASAIDGHITANGNIVLINPNGILFGASSRLDVGGLVASSSDLSDDDAFMANGVLKLDKPGNPDAQIINKGAITISEAGLAGFVAPHIENHGLVVAHLGRIALASGDISTIDFAGDGLIQIEVSDQILNQQVKNNGILKADGGTIVMTAAAGRNIVENLISNEGVLQARTVAGQKGSIRLSGPTATVQTTGLVDARGDTDTDGGDIDINASFVSLGGTITADGKNGGTITVSAGTLSLADTISATGLAGKGGTITLRSQTSWETSTSSLNASGLLKGGYILHIAENQIISSGAYWANSTLGDGGQIDISGWSTKFLSAQISADGMTHGGTIRLGGPYRGERDQPSDEDFPNAYYLIVDRGTRIRARALGTQGDGGTTILWADNENVTMGTIDVSPGTQSGNGGFVEVSSGDTLKFDASVTTGYPDRTGSLLLDPKNILISDFSFNSSAIILGYGYTGGRTNTNTNLDSGDGFGYAVSLNGNRMAVGTPYDDGDSNTMTNTGAVYLFSFQDSSFTGAILEGVIGSGYTGGKNINLTLENNDYFGSSVSLDGNRLAVGARTDDGSANVASDSGAVYLFTFSDSTFNGGALAATIGRGYSSGNNINLTTQLGNSDSFGYAVSLDGNRLAVSAMYDDGSGNVLTDSGAVYLFTFTDAAFSGGALAATLGRGYAGTKDLNLTQLGTTDYFGSAVSLDGNRLAVGAQRDDGSGNILTDSGAVYLFTFTDAAFSGGALAATIGRGYTGPKDVNLTQLDISDYVGSSVSLDGTHLAIGISGDDGELNVSSGYGSVQLYTVDATTFDNLTLVSTIGYQYSGNTDFNVWGQNINTSLGGSVSLDGNRLIGGTTSNSVYMFTFPSGNYSSLSLEGSAGSGYVQGRNYTVPNLNDDDNAAARAIALDGTKMAVGNPLDDGYNNAKARTGAVYLYSFTDTSYSGAVLEAIMGNGYTGGKNYNQPLRADARFGTSVSLDGNRLAVGVYGDNTYKGAVYLYDFSDATFSNITLRSSLGAGYTGANDLNLSAQLANYDYFGQSVSLDGNRLTVGAYGDDGSTNAIADVGAVYLFTFANAAFSTPTLAATIGSGYSGGKNLNLTQLGSSDYFGISVSLNGNRLAIGAQRDDGNGDVLQDAGAVYLLTFSDASFSTPSLAATIGSGYSGGKNLNLSQLGINDYFGTALSLDGNALAVGTYLDDGNANVLGDSGAVYLFTFTDSAFSGGTLNSTIGANYTGSHDYDLSGYLETMDYFGVSLNLDGQNLIIGSSGYDGYANNSTDSGAYFMFRYTDLTYSTPELLGVMGAGYGTSALNNSIQTPNLYKSDGFGTSVALSGTQMAIGAPYDDGFGNTGSNFGAVYLYTFDDTNYTNGKLQAIIGNGYTGGKNVNLTLNNDDYFGFAVSLDGNRLAVGAQRDDGSANTVTDAGAVYLFTFTDTTFSGGALASTIGYGYGGAKDINVAALGTSDYFATSVSLDGNRLAVGAQRDDGSGNVLTDSGAVYLFTFTDAAFSGGALAATIGKSYSGGKNVNLTTQLGASDYFGQTVSLDGNRLAVGALYDDGNANAITNSGAVYLFTFTDAAFTGGALAATLGYGYTGGKNINVNTLEANDSFGVSVALDGNYLAVGIDQDDGYNNLLRNTGAVKIYGFTDAAFTGGTLVSTIGYRYSGANDLNLEQSFIADVDDSFSTVALDGKNLLIGGRYDDPTGFMTDSGSVAMISFSNLSLSTPQLRGVTGTGYTNGRKNLSLPAGSYTTPDQYGYAVSLNANRLAVGAVYDDGQNDALGDSGAVYLYSIPGGDYDAITFEGIMGYGYTGGKNVDLSAYLNRLDYFGFSVSLDGNRLAVGTYADDGNGNVSGNSGAVYLFTFTDSVFSGGTLASTLGYGYTGPKDLNLTQLSGSDYFGYSVSLDGNRLAVGAQRDDGSANTVGDSGAVYLFTFADAAFSTPTLAGTLGYGYAGAKDLNLSQLGTSDYFGNYVSLDGNRLAVGAPRDDGNGNTMTDAGAVYLFTFADSAFSTPTLASTLGYGYTGPKDVNISTLFTSDQFGTAVALDGTVLAAGAVGDDGYNTDTTVGTPQGAIFLYTFSDLNFSNPTYDSAVGRLYTGGKNIDISLTTLGTTLSLDSGVLIAGQPGLSDPTGLRGATGRVYIFRDGLLPISSGSAFGTLGSNTIGITASSIAGLLSSGTNVTLQASNDITVVSPIFVNNGLGDGGALTLQAGRSIFLNSTIVTDNGDLNILANENLSTGVINNQRTTGASVITMGTGSSIDAGTGDVLFRIDAGTGKTYNQAGDMTLGTISAGTVRALYGTTVGNIYTSNVITATGTGDAIIFNSGANYINTYGAGALVTPAGRWLIYSDHSNYTQLNGLSPDFSYNNCTYSGGCATAIPGTGNGVMYEYAPHLLAITVNTSRAYGDANPNNAALQSLYTYSGFENGDDVNDLDVLPTATIASSADSLANAGTTHAISLSGGSDNYYEYYFLIPGYLTITKKDVTATWIAPLTRTYGGANPLVNSYNFSYTGLANGQNAGSLTATADYTGITATTNAGAYTIGATFSATNYNVINAPTTTLTINKLGITANWTGTLSRIYGDANPSVDTNNFTYTGFVNGDTNTAVTASANYLGTTSATPVGSYAVNGAFTSTNYIVTNTPSTTMTISKRNITATVQNDSRPYGDANPVWDWSDVTWSNLANSENGSVLDALTLSAATATSTSNAGTPHTIALSGFSDNNYNLTSTTNGTLTIAKRDITATIGAQTQLYGLPTPQPALSGITWNNMVNGDDGDDINSTIFSAPGFSSTSAAGTVYTLDIASLSDNNYNLIGSAPGTLTIQKAPLTIIASDALRKKGEENPIFTFTATGLQNGETIGVVQNLSLTTDADASSAAGIYPIHAQGGNADNYLILSYTDGALTVLPLPPQTSQTIRLPVTYEAELSKTGPALLQEMRPLAIFNPGSPVSSAQSADNSYQASFTVLPDAQITEPPPQTGNTLIFISEKLRHLFGVEI